MISSNDCMFVSCLNNTNDIHYIPIIECSYFAVEHKINVLSLTQTYCAKQKEKKRKKYVSQV